MPSDKDNPTACHEFLESRLEQIKRQGQGLLKIYNCTDPSGHVGEVANDVCLKIARSWEHIHSPEDAITTIVRNTASTHSRKCRRESPQEINEQDIPAFVIGAQDPREMYEQAILIQELCNYLSPEEVLIIDYLRLGLNFEEMAALIGSPCGTLRSRYSRALKKIKRVNH